MANFLPTSQLLANETLSQLKTNRVFTSMVDTDYQKYLGTAVGRYKSGATLSYPKPPRFQWRSGSKSMPQDIIKPTLSFTLSQGGTDYGFSSYEQTLTMSQIEDTVGAAIETCLNQIDWLGLDMARRRVGNVVGSPGVNPDTSVLALDMMLQANRRLDEANASVMRGRRSSVQSPELNSQLVKGMAGLFNSSTVLDKQYGNGMMVDSLRLQFGMSQNVARHTNGTQPSTAITVNGPNQGITNFANGIPRTQSFNISGSTGTITAGSVVSWPGVFTVNPQTKQPTKQLFQVSVDQDALAGATSIVLSQALVLTGPYQNVSAAPANGVGMTIVGAANAIYDTSLIFDRSAFLFAMLPMEQPPANTGVNCARKSQDGIEFLVTQGHDFTNQYTGTRLDFLFAWDCPYPELAVKTII